MLVQAKLVSLLDEVLHQKARLRKGGLQATYHCPFCPDKNPITQKLEIAIDGPKAGSFHCWRCDTKGGSLGTLLTKLKAPYAYREKVHAITGDIKVLRRNKAQDKSYIVLPDEFHPLIEPVDSPEYKNALHYVKKRGITLEDIVRYNIGYCEEGPYDGHVIIPSYDAEGNLNFFMGRRYYNLENAIPHKKPSVPMNIVGFECFVNYDEPLNICEGVFDAIAIRNNAIPLFGKYLQVKHLTAIVVNKVKRINMILDSDAMKDAIDNYQRLQKFGANIEIHVIKLDGKDPSVLGYSRMHEIIQNSTPFEFEDLIAHKMSTV